MQKYDPATYWDDRIAKSLDLASVGQVGMGRYNEVAYKLRLRAVKAAVEALNLDWAKTSLFEAGFGVGYYLSLWRALGIGQVVGVDLSPTAVKFAAAKHPEFNLFEHNLAHPINLPKESFQIATIIDVLYHIVDDSLWESAISNVASLIEPGGYLLITDKFPLTSFAQTASHVRRRPLSTYQAQLEKCGLEIISVKPIFVFMDDPILQGKPRWLAYLSHVQWRIWYKSVQLFRPFPRLQGIYAKALAWFQLPLELIWLSAVSRSPNLELLVARKQG